MTHLVIKDSYPLSETCLKTHVLGDKDKLTGEITKDSYFRSIKFKYNYQKNLYVVLGKSIEDGENEYIPICEVKSRYELNQLFKIMNIKIEIPDTPDIGICEFGKHNDLEFTRNNIEDNKELINSVWEKGRTIENIDPNMFRLDACGAMIMKDKVGNSENYFGWVIDHINPNGSMSNLDNMRPLNVMNDISKGNDYPSYLSHCKWDGDRNVYFQTNMTIKNWKEREGK